MKSKSLINRFIAAPYIVWSALFIIVPLLIMFYFALTDANGVFTFANLSGIGKYGKAFGISVLYAAISTVIPPDAAITGMCSCVPMRRSMPIF